MDLQTLNTLLFGAIGVLIIVAITLRVKLHKAHNRLLDLNLDVKTEQRKAQLAEEKRVTAENLMNEERGKLGKIHLLNFSAWLFRDEEFVSAIASKVDELRAAALDRYNTKQQEELKKRADEDAAAMKRSSEIYEANLRGSASITGKERIVSGGGISGTSAIVPLMTSSTDVTPSFTSVDTCSVDASCM